MSGVECVCGTNSGNLGSPNCPPEIGKLLKANFQNLYQDNGTRNYIDTTVTLNAAFWNALQYNASTDIRIYPIPEILEEVEALKENTVYKTYKSGRMVKIRQGFRNFVAKIVKGAAALVDKINSRGCSKLGVYFHTTKGLLGWYTEAGKLYPIPISQDSLDAILQLQNEDDPQYINLMLQWAQNVTDGKLAIIPYSAIDPDFDLKEDFRGMLDTNITQLAGNRSTTTFTVDISFDYGDSVSMQPVSGLVTADFDLDNVTDSTQLTITSATEDPLVPGRYAFVISVAQTATDDLRLSLNSTTNAQGFDDATWEDVVISLD
jgi:hypothetical protein